MVASYWDKLAQSLPHGADDPHTRENAEIVRDWLRLYSEGRRTLDQLNAALPQGFYLFQFCMVFGHKHELYPVLCDVIDARKAAEGLVWCKWRGWIRREEYGL